MTNDKNYMVKEIKRCRVLDFSESAFDDAMARVLTGQSQIQVQIQIQIQVQIEMQIQIQMQVQIQIQIQIQI